MMQIRVSLILLGTLVVLATVQAKTIYGEDGEILGELQTTNDEDAPADERLPQPLDDSESNLGKRFYYYGRPRYECGGHRYYPLSQICCCGKVYIKKARFKCCGYAYHNRVTSKCCHYYSVTSKRVKCPKSKV